MGLWWASILDEGNQDIRIEFDEYNNSYLGGGDFHEKVLKLLTDFVVILSLSSISLAAEEIKSTQSKMY